MQQPAPLSHQSVAEHTYDAAHKFRGAIEADGDKLSTFRERVLGGWCGVLTPLHISLATSTLKTKEKIIFFLFNSSGFFGVLKSEWALCAYDFLGINY